MIHSLVFLKFKFSFARGIPLPLTIGKVPFKQTLLGEDTL